MTNLSKEQLYKKYSELPKDIRGLLLNDDLGPFIHSISKKNGLNPIQSLDIEDEVAFVLLGTKNKKDLALNIADSAKIDSEKAADVARDIESMIFEDINESLKKIQPTKKDVGIKIKTPDKSNVSEEVMKKETNAIPPVLSPADTATGQTHAIYSKEDSPVTPPSPPKPIVGAEQVGVGVPSPVTPRERASLELQGEHMFEKKLRDSTQVQPKQEIGTVENLQQERASNGIDPYREMPEQ